MGRAVRTIIRVDTMHLTARVDLLTGATGEFGRAIARTLAGRRTWSTHDLHAWHVLSTLDDRYLPWNSGSMRPSGLVMVLNDICINSRQRVVECGSGISTIYLARLLRERGGKLVTLEHDERWRAYVSSELEREGLEGFAKVLLAPLERHHMLAGNLWYARAALEEAVSEIGEIELLLVDGPPAVERRHRLARYPALPSCADALTDDCTVVLDDIERRGERHVIARWEDESAFRFKYWMDPGGVAIGRRPGYPLLGYEAES
jgi:predicted O-methyltransferase YrrM